jgi:DDE superfamily endonuclease
MEKMLRGWRKKLLRAHQRAEDLFPRSEVRERSLAYYLGGLLRHCEGKNSWQVTEWAGEASPYGMQYLLDREMYLPEAWIEDGERCRAASIPAEVPFATKPMLDRQMLERAFAAGMPAGWVVDSHGTFYPD